jgi:methyl-accepting chemotaxis protein
VVATEVRNLAHRSAEAAKEIKVLINESVSRIDAGNAQATQAGHQMTEIVDAIGRVSLLINDIAAASSEQTQGIEQITQAVNQMDEVTQQNAALVEEAAAASESLQEQAQELATAVAAFKTSDGRSMGRGPGSAVSPSALRTVKHSGTPSSAKRVAASPGKNTAALSAKLVVSDEETWEEF